MKNVLPWIAAAALGGSAPALADHLIVLNKSDHTAVLVDPIAGKVVAKLPTGQGPHEVATSVDGKRAYVSNYGAFAIFRETGRRRMEAGRTLTVIDLEQRRVANTFTLGDYTSPHGIVVSGDGRVLWVTCEGARAVLEVDAARGEVLKAWKTDQDLSHMIVPSADEKKLFIANIGSGSVTVIDRESGKVRSIPTGPGAEGIDRSPDGSEVWVTNRGGATISILDSATDRVITSIPSGGDMPIRVKFTPDGREAWVSCARSNRVTVFDAKSRELLQSIDVGAVPVGIQMSPDGKRAFVANTNDDQVTMIDVSSRKVVRTLRTGKEPDGMAWAPAAK